MLITTFYHPKTTSARHNFEKPLIKSSFLPRQAARKKCGNSVLIDGDFAEELEVGEHFAGAEDDGGQGVVGDGDREAGLFAYALV
jgi:hypothetical protein